MNKKNSLYRVSYWKKGKNEDGETLVPGKDKTLKLVKRLKKEGFKVRYRRIKKIRKCVGGL